MRNVEPQTRECGGHAVVVLRGELDTADAEAVACAVAALTADGRQLIIDLGTLDFLGPCAGGRPGTLRWPRARAGPRG